jgi:hypothetical protein
MVIIIYNFFFINICFHGWAFSCRYHDILIYNTLTRTIKVVAKKCEIKRRILEKFWFVRQENKQKFFFSINFKNLPQNLCYIVHLIHFHLKKIVSFLYLLETTGVILFLFLFKYSKTSHNGHFAVRRSDFCWNWTSA